MASKSKRRRRVLGASCILAALIIAGSSFAWFTSKDEVNNRLSANADYGVSIVESFAPPENWVPGQEVNKDVYAVNTGNVGAFVEETVSGKLTITTEVAKDDISANSVKLTAAERYAVEAGSYLAYKPAASNKELGVQVVSMIPDATNLEGYTTANAATDFTPDAAGLYVFRRSIGVDANTKVETFKYEAYYFDGHYYYKVTDLSVTPDGTSYEGDNVTTDGNLTSATAKFVEEETKTINPTALTYDSDNNRLVASYDTGAEIANNKLKELAKAYDNALISYQDALNEYNAALRDAETADGTATSENNSLQSAINNLLAKQKALQEALATKTAAEQAQAATVAAKQAAQDAKDATELAKANAQAALQEASTNYTNAQAATQAAQDEVATAQDAVDAAQAAVDNYTNSDSKNAFETYCANNSIDLNTISYEDLLTFGITNTAVEYDYYEKVVELKSAQKTLAEKQAVLAQRQADEALMLQRQTDAQAAYNAADAADGQAATDLATATDADNAAQDALDAATAAYDSAVADEAVAQTEVDNAQGAYDTAAAAAGSASDDVTTAANALAVARQAMTEAQNAYENAVDARDGVLKININLADAVTTDGDVADKWQLLPDPVNGGTAYFYYTSILGAGQTSAQLIDSVELDSSVTDDMFKRFDFDLNVALKSAQITKDADGKITTDATTELDANATLVTPTSVDSVVNWTLK